MSRNPPPQKQDNTNNNNSRNEYIPQYISAKPFYAEDLLQDTEYLSHQRSKAEQKDTLDKARWYERGTKRGPAATKFRKGACENCGAMTHKIKECLSRPRKVGARFSGRDIQADEVVEDVRLGWDAKRDRWNGFDVREYDAVVRDYEDLESLRKVVKSKSPGADDQAERADGEGGEGIDGADGDHYAEETDMGRSQPTSTRQLRLREDTAKYLLNLDLDSAKYDPKTRSMDTTALALNDKSKLSDADDIASEGFVRPTPSHDPASDAAAFERAQRYAWESVEKPAHPSVPVPQQIEAGRSGSKVHLEANPTASAIRVKQAELELAEKKKAREQFLREKYGESAAQPSSSSSSKLKPLPSATSTFTTYDPETGAAIDIDPTTGKQRVNEKARSRYPEDIYPGNHTSVFGSWWRDGKWGFKCCRSFVRNSWCTGEEGRRGFEEEEAQRRGMGLIESGQREAEGQKEVVEASGRKRKAEENVVEEDGGKREKRSRTEELT